MPKVPSYSSPQVQSEATPNVRISSDVSASAFGGGASAAQLDKTTNAFLGQVQQIQAEEKKKGDQVAFMDADSSLSALQTKLEYDPEVGYTNRRGKAALGAPEQLQKEWTSKVEEIEKGLSNDEQKAAFRRSAQSRWGDLDKGLQRHVSVEIKNYDTQTTEAYLENTANEAVANYRDPERVGLALQRNEAALYDFGTRHGLPEEVIKQKIVESQSKLHTSIMDRMLANGEDMAASQYYQANKDRFAGADVVRAERNLEEGTLRGESQRIAEQITAKHGSLSSGLEAIKGLGIEDVKLQDAVRDRVKREYSDRKMAEDDRNEKNMISATNIIEKTRDISQIPPGQWNRYTPSQRSQLRNYEKSLREGRDVETDMKTYYNVKTMATNPSTRDKFLRTDLYSTYINKLGKAEFKEMVELQTSLRSGDGKGAKQLDGYLSDAQVADGVFAEAKLDPKSDEQLYLQYRTGLDRQVQQLNERTGKRATNEDIRRIGKSLLVQGVTQKGKGILYDTKQFNMELRQGEEFEDVIVPDEDSLEIQAELRKRGKMPDKKTIIQYYLKGISNGK